MPLNTLYDRCKIPIAVFVQWNIIYHWIVVEFLYLRDYRIDHILNNVAIL